MTRLYKKKNRCKCLAGAPSCQIQNFGAFLEEEATREKGTSQWVDRDGLGHDGQGGK